MTMTKTKTNMWENFYQEGDYQYTSGVELRIWLKQGKEKAQTRKGKKTAGKEKDC